MIEPVRITVDRSRLAYWEGVPWLRWPRAHPGRVGRWTFRGFVNVVRFYLGPGRSFEIALTHSAARETPQGASPGAPPRA
jgi:hypothetical protein